MFDLAGSIIDFILHIDVHLAEITSNYGMLTYFILFAIVFAETGFVVTPFLPGDSLLFAAGALAALGTLNVWLIIGFLLVAAIVGDAVNYWIGHFLGRKIIESPKIPFIDKDNIEEAQKFYDKHGGKAIVLARFVPIVRTFAPFVAGVGKMNYGKFLFFNVIGAVAWVCSFTLVGYFFGNIPAIKHNFSLVVFAIIGISLVPIVIESIKAKKKKQQKAQK